MNNICSVSDQWPPTVVDTWQTPQKWWPPIGFCHLGCAAGTIMTAARSFYDVVGASFLAMTTRPLLLLRQINDQNNRCFKNDCYASSWQFDALTNNWVVTFKLLWFFILSVIGNLSTDNFCSSMLCQVPNVDNTAVDFALKKEKQVLI